MIFEFEHPLLGLYLTSEQNFDYWTYFQLGFSFSFKVSNEKSAGKTLLKENNILHIIFSIRVVKYDNLYYK